MTSKPIAGAGPASAPMTQRRFVQIIIATVVLGFFLLAGIGAATLLLLTRQQEFAQRVNHTYEVEALIAQFRGGFDRAEAARRGYLIEPRGRYENTFNANAPFLEQQLAEIRRLTQDNPGQQTRLDRLQPMLREKQDLWRQSIELRRSGDLMGAMTSFGTDREQELLDTIRQIADEMAANERVLLNSRTAQQTGNAQLLFGLAAIAGLMLAALAVISLWVMRRFAADLTRSQQALRQLNEGLEAAVRERTSDLQRANDEIQRFAYIVSHDLRSPLVNIMGFTSELEAATKPLQKLIRDAEAAAPDIVSADARAAVELDLPESVGFIRSSTQKMDRLINAILKLSREGRRTLYPEPLDLVALADGVAGSLKIMADEKGAIVRVERPLPQIVSDRVAIEQVVSNLIENALKYLKPGRPGEVLVRGHVEGGRVIIEVQDNGRGIDPKDHERIFELFRRAGAQDQPGEGIGLAHVRALVYRLGGLISCVSELDQGATFRLSLPHKLTISSESA